eukprot:11994133-Alexandrium_andersonii.AAC.1
MAVLMGPLQQLLLPRRRSPPMAGRKATRATAFPERMLGSGGQAGARLRPTTALRRLWSLTRTATSPRGIL